MSGGGGDTPPQPPPQSATGGEFLLQLLHKPSNRHHQQQLHSQQQQHQLQTPQQLSQHKHLTPPQSIAALDPAVAAVGPSITYPAWPSNDHDLTPPHPWLHSLSPPIPPHFLGFLQNPPWSSPTGFHHNDDFNHSQVPQFSLNHGLIDDDVRKLGFLGMNLRGNSLNSVQQSEHKLMFGSLPCEIRTQEGFLNGNSDRKSVSRNEKDGLLAKFDTLREREMGLGHGIINGPDRNWNFDSPANSNSNAVELGSCGYRQYHGGVYRSVTATEPRPPPPGFPNRPRGVGNRDSLNSTGVLEHNVAKEIDCSEKLSHRAFASNDKVEKRRLSPEERKMRREVRLSEQLDRPGPPSGTNLHSVSALEIEESLMDLHGDHVENGDRPRFHIQDKMKSDDGDRAVRELDDLGEQLLESLGLDDRTDAKNDSRKHHKHRDKYVRSDTRGQQLLSQRIRNFKRQMECRGDIDRLSAGFLAIYESLIPAEEEKAKQNQLLTLLEKLVSQEWPKAQLYLYGSCANTFGVSRSDIDVCLAIEDADIDKSEVLLKLADILQSDNLQNVQALTRARVPIVKLLDPATEISCDICINNVLAVVNTKLLRDYAQIDVRLRQLAFIVKHWAKSRGVNETYQGTLSSYAYVLMCIHFLQQRTPAILPCLQRMKTTYSVTVDNVECSYFDQVDKLQHFGSDNKESIARLVWAFFNYWAYYHDYANSVISVRTGCTVSKRAKDWTRRIGNDRHLICIEDPFEISHDLGRVVDKFSIKVLREEFERAAYIMQCDPDPCVRLFETYIPS